MKVKICGLMRPVDAEYANAAMPDYVGFILSPGFRRSIPEELACRLRGMLRQEIQVVGVFVDAPVEEVVRRLEEGLIDMAQLHGGESEEDIQYIKAVTHKPVIKAVRVQSRYEVEAWLDSSADYLLFDSGTGTGKTFGWEALEDVGRDFFLAGGINAGNMAEAAERLSPYAVDVSSGVETEGHKDLEKMTALVKMARTLAGERHREG